MHDMNVDIDLDINVWMIHGCLGANIYECQRMNVWMIYRWNYLVDMVV